MVSNSREQALAFHLICIVAWEDPLSSTIEPSMLLIALYVWHLDSYCYYLLFRVLATSVGSRHAHQLSFPKMPISILCQFILQFTDEFVIRDCGSLEMARFYIFKLSKVKVHWRGGLTQTVKIIIVFCTSSCLIFLTSRDSVGCESSEFPHHVIFSGDVGALKLNWFVSVSGRRYREMG